MSTATEQQHLIEPHGGKLVDRTGPRPDGVEQLEQLALTSRELSDLDMLASGALSPLEGFMARHDYESVVETCGWRTACRGRCRSASRSTASPTATGSR